jgi:hypothetical protein
MSLDRLVDLMPAVAFFVLAAYFWRTKRRQPRSDIWMIPTLASIAGALSFWIAEQADSWPMAVAGLAAYLLALTFVRVPRRLAPWRIKTTVTDLGPMLPLITSRKELRGLTENVDRTTRSLDRNQASRPALSAVPDRPVTRIDR